jgi:hypothetical protein
MDPELKTFKFRAAIHPKNGGDDYLVEGNLRAKDEAEAKREIEKHLKRRSAVIDYVIIK